MRVCAKKALEMKTILTSSFRRFKTSTKLVGPSLQVMPDREARGGVNLEMNLLSIMLLSTEGERPSKGRLSTTQIKLLL